MDFPITLSSRPEFVDNLPELKQTIYALLYNEIGSFSQKEDLGALFSIHSASEELLEEGIRKTMDQIKAVSVQNIVVNGTDVLLQLSYKGEDVTLRYSFYED